MGEPVPGAGGSVLGIDGVAVNDSGIYFGTKLVLVEGQSVNMSPFGSCAVWNQFEQLGGKRGSVKINDRNQLLIGCRVKDPGLSTSPLTRTIALLDLDGSGNLLSGTVVAVRPPTSASS